jgi:hypothetical protein
LPALSALPNKKIKKIKIELKIRHKSNPLHQLPFPAIFFLFPLCGKKYAVVPKKKILANLAKETYVKIAKETY